MMKSRPIPFKNVPLIKRIKNDFPDVKALFFDMDGTLFNTEMIHAEALFKMAKKYQIRPPFDQKTVYELMVGKADHLLFDIIKDWEGVPSHWNHETFVVEKNDHFMDLLNQISSESFFMKDVENLIMEAHTSGLFLGLVTSSEKYITNELLRITGLKNIFHLIITRDDCPRHKPDPWPYIKATEVSGFLNHEILIFEDSKVGLEAATATGSHVIKVEWY